MYSFWIHNYNGGINKLVKYLAVIGSFRRKFSLPAAGESVI